MEKEGADHKHQLIATSESYCTPEVTMCKLENNSCRLATIFKLPYGNQLGPRRTDETATGTLLQSVIT